MSVLLRSILQGLGWELGKTAAKEAVVELRNQDATSSADRTRRDVEKTHRQAEQARREASKAQRRAEKARKKETARREREVDAELAALKKRLNSPR